MFSHTTGAFALAFSLFVSQTTASCIHGTSLHRRAEGGPVEVSKFGYTGLLGPLNWHNLGPENSACADSRVQSPININSQIPLASEKPVINIPNVESAVFENLGTTVEVIVNGTTTFAGKEFQLKQFHFHTPSEHRIAEEYFPLEVHMVHEAADKSIAVLALTFDISESGATTNLITEATRNIKEIVTPGTSTTTGPLNFDEVKAHIESVGLFQYTGSLTTPPCAEGLTFLVAQHPMAINVATYNAIKSVVKFNSRYTQNNPNEDNLIAVAKNGGNNGGAGGAAPTTTETAAVAQPTGEPVGQPAVAQPEVTVYTTVTEIAPGPSPNAKLMKRGIVAPF